ncbi:hypothetical protein ACHAQC_009382 [Fusarium culmorum]
MDANNFLTDFNICAHGILETINQTLAQSSPSRQWTGFRAELCKLDVFSAHSGTSQPLVNNPGLSRQMASLVVCLPVTHKGGKLTVREKDQQVEFDWESGSSHAIQWVAFFRFSELEVLPITEGHRLTLTYNLFWADYLPVWMAENVPDQESSYFYSELEKLIEKIKSTGEQHLVGFTCTHAYPHTSRSSHENLHKMLKSIDMVVYQALERLVGDVYIGAVLDDSQYVESQLEMKQMELERRSSPYEYDDSDFEDTVCMTGDPS